MNEPTSLILDALRLRERQLELDAVAIRARTLEVRAMIEHWQRKPRGRPRNNANITIVNTPAEPGELEDLSA